jgi:DNA-binding beta-propeller fold protein YncE
MKQSFACFLLFAASAFPAEPPGLRLVQTVLLAGVEGRIDHMAADVSSQRLFVAALGNNSVEVVDLRTGRPIHRIGGMQHPQDVAWIPDRNQLFVASGQDAAVKVFSGKSYRLESTLEGMDDADNVRHDVRANLIYVGYGDGALAVIDAATAKRVGDIGLSGHPESFRLERNGSRIFVNVPTAKHVAVVSRERMAVTAAWPVEPAAANFPMALDEEHHRLFVV